MRLQWIVFLLVVFFAASAHAGNWNSCGARGSATATASDQYADAKIKPGGSICWDPVDGDLDSVTLRVTQCENFDAIFEPDMSGAGVAISCAVRSCVSNSAASASCGAIGGVTLTGVPPNTELYGAAAEWIYADCSGTIGSETPRLLIHCNGPSK